MRSNPRLRGGSIWVLTVPAIAPNAGTPTNPWDEAVETPGVAGEVIPEYRLATRLEFL
jgi:hypothetical protein